MTSQSEKNTVSRWRRIAVAGVASTSLAAALTMGFGTATANAAPEDPATPTDSAPPTTADQVLAIIAKDYDTGAGGGQLSNLIEAVMKLRAQGFMPSNANKQAIVHALDYRPNQIPLINALQDTLSYQQKKQEQATPQSSGGVTVGINQYDPDNPSAIGGFGITGPNGGGVGVGGGGN